MATSAISTTAFHVSAQTAAAHQPAQATGQHSALGQLKKAAPGSARTAMRRNSYAGPPALPIINRQLASHTVVPQAQVQPMRLDQAIARAQQMRLNMQRVKLLARDMIKKREFVRASQKKAADNESEEWLAALHIALAVEASGSNEENTAALTPFGEGHSKQELAALVREQLSEDGELSDEAEQFLDDVLGDASAEDEEEFVIDLRQADDNQMMKLLRDKQGLSSAFGEPGRTPDEQEINTIREAIEQYQAESTGEGQQAVLGFNIAPAIANAPNRDQLKAFYKELVKIARTWIETMQLVLTHFGADEIDSVSADLQKALAFDEKAGLPSHEPVRLGALMDHMQNTKLMRTVLGMAIELKRQMNGLPRVQHG
jgi:hypothetical protein